MSAGDRTGGVDSDPLADTAAVTAPSAASARGSDPEAETVAPSWWDAAAERGAGAPALADAPEVSPSHYQMLGEQGRGGLGRVLRARDLRTGRIVAIKEILRGSEAAVRRFRREALVTANLQHPAIVPVYEVGRWPDGQPFYAMKLVEGEPLSAAIQAATATGDRLALVPHVIQVADALAYAHAQGWIHRDLKPGNVLVGAFGETVVIDWGLAKRLDALPSAPEIESSRDPLSAPDGVATIDGQVLGTPVYMPPEQARGEPVDARADVYAIGALLYHVLAGVPPYHGARTAAEVIAAVTTGPPRPLRELAPGLPAELATIVTRAMAHRADDRYPSARELADELGRFRAGNLVAAHAYTLRELVRRWVRRHRTAVAVGVLALAALATLGAISFQQNLIARRRAEAERRRATVAQGVAEDRRRDAEARVAALHTELGLRELSAGAPARALPYLADAYRKAPTDPIAGFLIGRALESIAQLELAIDAGPVISFTFGGGRALAMSPAPAPVLDLEHHRALAVVSGSLAALAPDGTWLVASRDDGDVLAIDVVTGTERARRAPADGAATTRWLDLDRTGRVITIDERGAVTASGADLIPTATRQIPFAVADAVFAGAAGRHVLVAGGAGELWRWDPATGAATQPRSPHRDRTELCASADGAVWMSMDRTATVVWRHEVEVARVAHAGLVGGCAIDRAGHTAVTSVDGVGVAWWDLTAARPAPAPTLLRLSRGDVPNNRDTPTISGDGAVAAIGDHLGQVELIELRTGLSQGRTIGHDAPVVTLAFSPDDRHLVTATLAGDVRVWRNAPTSAVAAVPLGRRGYGGGFLDADRAVVVGSTGARIVAVSDGRTLRELVGHADEVTATALAPAGDRFATASRDGTARLWRGDGTLIAVLAGGGDRVRRIGLTHAGDRVLTATADGAVALWRGVDGALERRLAPGTALFAARLSPDGQRLVTMPEGAAAATLWDAATGARLAELAPAGLQAVDAQFTPDGALVAIPAAGMVLAVFDGRTGAPSFQVEHEGHAIATAWSADGAVLVSSDMAGTIQLTHRDGTRFRSFRVDRAVTAVALHPGGRMLAVAAEDGTVRVHETDGGRELARLWQRAFPVELAFSPGGGHLVIGGSDDRPVLIWNLASYAGTSDALDARVRCAVPYRLDPSMGLVATTPDPTACR